ncbi:basal body-orientation factor 1-like [Menidia menidia]
MPGKKASKVKRAKGGKGKKDSKNVPKADKESDVETARANAALWELRLKVTEQDVAEYREESHKLARANEQLTSHLYRAEKSSVDLTGYWEKEVASKEKKISALQESLRKQEALALEERNKVARDFSRMQDKMREMEEREAQMEQELGDMKESMAIADKDYREHLNNLRENFRKEKECLETEVMQRCKTEIAVLKLDHREAIAKLEGALHDAFKKHDQLNESLRKTTKEAEDLKRLAHTLSQDNNSLGVERDLIESMLKKTDAQLEWKKKKFSELRVKVTALEEALELKEEKLEQQDKQAKMSLVTIQASQVELEKLQKSLAVRDKEMLHVKQLASAIVKKRTELEEFFHEVLDHVRQEIVANRIQYKKEALQDYRQRFREATAGKIKFPPIRTFHKSPYSTNSVYSDMEATSQWSHRSTSEVQISDLSWEQKEQVLSLLFAKMNGLQER